MSIFVLRKSLIGTPKHLRRVLLSYGFTRINTAVSPRPELIPVLRRYHCLKQCDADGAKFIVDGHFVVSRESLRLLR